MANTERLSLPDGQWADITTRLNHAQSRRLRRAKADPDRLVVVDEFVATMTVGWSLRDLAGNDLPYPPPAFDGIPAETLDNLPADTVDAIFLRCSELYAGAPDPNASAGTSPGSPSEPKSE